MSLAVRAGRGALGGAAATAAMTAVMLAGKRLGRLDRLAPRVIVERPLRAAGVTDDDRIAATTAVAHLGYGVANGSLFGVLAPHVPGPPVARGVAYAGALLLLSYQGWVPAARLLPPLSRQAPERRWNVVVSHLVYGTVLGRLAGR